MKFLKPIFLRDRVFYALGGIVFTFCIGFVWPLFLYVATTLLSALVLIIIADLYILYKAAQGVEASRVVPRHFSMFDDNEVELTLANKSNRKLNLRIIDELPVQFQERNFQIDLQLTPSRERKVSYSLKPLTRGEYFFEDLHLFISGKIGLVEYRKSLTLQKLVKVYPSFIQMRVFELMVFNATRSDAGIKKIRRIGHGYEFSDIRQYVPGDDPRAINWKASSRTAEIMINNFQEEKSQQVYAVINKSRVMRMPFGGLSLMDYAINTSLAILNIALRNQDHAGLMTFAKNTEEFIPARKRSNQLQLILDNLYNIEESKMEANYQGLFQSLRQKVKSRSLLLMFTNFMSLNSLKRVLPELKRINRSHLLVVIFFENTELEEFRMEPVKNASDIASKTMADRLSEELTQVIYELRNAGIQAIKSKPDELTANTVNKYLELKSRGMI